MSTILVFPAGLPDALRFRAEAEARGDTVIGASSLAFDVAQSSYAHWDFLPFVHDDGFPPALKEVVTRRHIDAIYTPHDVVAGRLADIMAESAPGARLIEASPMRDKERAYRDLRQAAERQRTEDWFAASPLVAKPRLSAIQAAGLTRLVDTIPGMCDGDKIAVVMEMMRHAPAGDIVEIGSWWGRSAALFNWLGRHYGVGPMLCVDPWSSAELPQGVAVLDRASAAMDTDEALAIFQVNLSPLARGDLNYLRARSTDGAAAYGPGLVVDTPAFGRVAYAGQIAVLHIDGNHAYDSVAADARAWIGYVKPGGWIIFDDYVWAFGDGPRVVGDAFLVSDAGRIAFSFVMGTALFVQLKT
jgi:hypothetical protein